MDCTDIDADTCKVVQEVVHAGTKFRPAMSKADSRYTLSCELQQFCESSKFDVERAKRYCDLILQKFDSIQRGEPDIRWKIFLRSLHQDFVITACDKTPQTFAVICKGLYEESLRDSISTFQPVKNIEEVSVAIQKFNDLANSLHAQGTNSSELPHLYVLPKMHKLPTDGITMLPKLPTRTILGSHFSADNNAPTNYTYRIGKLAGRLYTALLYGAKEVNAHHMKTKKDAINKFFCVLTTQEFPAVVNENSEFLRMKDLEAIDLSNCYTNLPQDLVLEAVVFFYNLSESFHARKLLHKNRMRCDQLHLSLHYSKNGKYEGPQWGTIFQIPQSHRVDVS
ncbi:Hypothetical protein, putative [Bodo saltans]|uniref:Uncharacterized protein n=1 Tax=Bodo saltans TaxID=75058 RepID=A0A0S4IKR0_BODSA|nr:Hypothetical protein, putative [Bodo saltans]|eukprot:CUE65541.1 Hypothetical protein, putative [Bodo saltans]